MKELSIEEKAKAYDEALKVLHKYDGANIMFTQDLKEEMFPELKESDNTDIRTEIKNIITYFYGSTKLFIHLYSKEELLAWLEKQGELVNSLSKGLDNAHKRIDELIQKNNLLIEQLEKQGEQKLADKVEPKFKVGDWIVCCDYEPVQIIGIRTNAYEMSNGDIRPFYMIDNNHNIRLWTIQDAKDGDVLATLSHILIFEKLLPKDGGVSYCHYDFGCSVPQFDFNKDDCWYFGKEAKIYPATKEQRDFLFAKMKEAGYEWDSEKRELKKIEQEPIDTHKFKINDIIRYNGAKYKIHGIDSVGYKVIPLTYDEDSVYLISFGAPITLVEQKPTEFNVGDEIVEASAFRDKLLELFQKFRWKDFKTNGDIIDYVDSHIHELMDSIHKPAEWEPQTGDTFRKKGTTSPTYHLCDKREDGITFSFVENREVGIAGGEISIFALRQDYELIERPKSIEDVVEEEFHKVVCPNDAWSEEDDNCLSTIIAEFSKCSGKSVSKDEWMRCNDFLNSIKDRIQPQQEWSKEDEINASYICAALDCYYRLREERNNTNGQEDLNKARNWLYNKLKSLKPKNKWKLSAWSKEEQQIIEDAASFILACVNTAETKKEEERLEELADKLQDLMLKKQWKPSEGQLECLGYAIEHAEKDWSPLTNNRIYLTLKALKEQLEKL